MAPPPSSASDTRAAAAAAAAAEGDNAATAVVARPGSVVSAACSAGSAGRPKSRTTIGPGQGCQPGADKERCRAERPHRRAAFAAPPRAFADGLPQAQLGVENDAVDAIHARNFRERGSGATARSRGALRQTAAGEAAGARRRAGVDVAIFYKTPIYSRRDALPIPKQRYLAYLDFSFLIAACALAACVRRLKPGGHAICCQSCTAQAAPAPGHAWFDAFVLIAACAHARSARGLKHP